MSSLARTFVRPIVVVAILISSVLLNAQQANAGTVTANGWTFVSSVTTSATDSTIIGTFTAPANGSYTLDLEIWDAAKVKRFAKNGVQTLAAGQTGSLTVVLPNSSTPIGSYTARQGVWTGGWATKVAGVTQTSAFSVGVPPPPAVTQASTTSAWTMRSSATTTVDAVNVSAYFTAPSPTSGSLVMQVEVWNSTGAVSKKNITQAMSGGQTATISYSVPLTSLPSGAYTVRQGVWDYDWSPKFAGLTQTSSFRTGTVAPAVPADPNAGDPLDGVTFYGTNKGAAAQATTWATSRPEDAAVMTRLANTPTATWFGGGDPDIGTAVERVVSAAAAKNQVPVLVSYNIPDRDCGSYSSGGTDEENYATWVQNFAAAIGNRKAVVIIEPDALAQLCNTDSRYRSLNAAVNAFSALPNAIVYLDAGHPKWVDPATMAARLQLAGISKIRGFAVNVAAFAKTPDDIAYGDAINAALGTTGPKHYVIDTTRNLNGSNGEWCNPLGRGLGEVPTSATASSTVDAYLWVKTPGISDGPCNGGPAAGQWWADYALNLARTAGW